MDFTAFAIALIKSYKREHNRYRRALAAKHRIYSDQSYLKEMKEQGFDPYIHMEGRGIRRYEKKQLRNCFRTPNDVRPKTPLGFVSAAIKREHLKEITKQLAQMAEASTARIGIEFNPSYTDKLNEKELVNKIPVLAELGKKWRTLVDACCEEHKAYEDRWEARCAIKAFNKMDTGIHIKFGNCGHKGGSMSYIRFVTIDGFDIPIRKFLENAQFEQVILSA